MKQYTIRRILQLIPVLLGIRYSDLRRHEDDPRRRDPLGILGVEATPELPAQLAAKCSLDRPISYSTWTGSAACSGVILGNPSARRSPSCPRSSPAFR